MSFGCLFFSFGLFLLGLLLLLLALGNASEPVQEQGSEDVENDVDQEDAVVAPSFAWSNVVSNLLRESKDECGREMGIAWAAGLYGARENSL